jgi:glycosyltransferase involved in cell wall biosynthesis
VRVLHAIHDFLPRHRAGSELYALHLCRALAARHRIGILCADYDPRRAHGEIVRREHEGLPVFELINNWSFERFEETYRSAAIAERIERVLDEFRPDLVHVHNLLNLSLDLPALAKRRGLPVVATLHDHTLHCPSGGQRVHVAEQHVCMRIDPERCARCFGASPFAGQMALSRRTRRIPRPALRALGALGRRLRRTGAALAAGAAPGRAPSAAEIRGRLRHVERAIEAVDLFVAPSRALAEEHLRLGIPAAKLRTSDYGFPGLPRSHRPPRTDPASRLAIGFVGTLVWHKGVHVLLEAAALLPRDRFELLVFGDLETFPAYVADLRRQAEGLPVRFLGGFANAEAGRVYAELDVLVVPSFWPENSPLVIHEAFMAGVPVVGARMGGIPELLQDGASGLLYDAGSAAELAQRLALLIDSPLELARLSASAPPVKTIERDAAEWEAIYSASVAPRAAAGAARA